MEKHFPAPDRNRINRILGLTNSTNDEKSRLQTIIAEVTQQHRGGNKGGQSAGSHKRRSSESDGNKSTKRSRNNSWNDSDTDSRQSESDSDEISHSESNDDESDSASESSDFNPFVSDSNSDDEPWVARAKTKKQTKTKKLSGDIGIDDQSSIFSSNNNNNSNSLKGSKKKTTLTTQDKIQELLTKKQELKETNSSHTPIGAHSARMKYGPPPKDAIERACLMKEELLRKIERLGERLPPNTLDQLIDELGGPENVAEMTGRKGRVVQSDDGSIQYESRSGQDAPLETLNITEKQRFMNGEKDVAIISEAASSGISLQSDRRVRNQRRRVHITLELPWSADRAVQQFGRTHRSNQVNAPEYIFLISDLAGERRFASTVAKRLESLGALTHGDRRATETRDLSQFNIDNKYGRNALETVMKAIMGYERPLVPPPSDYSGDFFKDIARALVGVGIIVNSESNPGVLSLDKDYNSISKFLNRILGMPVEMQNRLFTYFTDTLNAIINQAKKSGRFDLGILGTEKI